MISPGSVNQLLVIIVSGLQADKLMKQLTQQGFYFTKIDSSGGMLQESMVCLLVGLNNQRVAELLDLIGECCQSYRQYIPTQMSISPDYGHVPMIEAQVGGATIFSMNIERFEQI